MNPRALLVLCTLLGAAVPPFAAQAQKLAFQISDKYYALLLAVDHYADPNIQSLDFPVADARRLREVLVQDYQFDQANVQLVANPNRRQIYEAFENMGKKMNVTDNLFIFFAGHGDWEKEGNVGYWWPSDTRLDSDADKINSSDLRLLVSKLNCRHVLLVVDACYGGGLFKSRGPSASDQALQEMYEKASRKAMTSTELEVVLDQSQFADALIGILRENPDRYLPGQDLFNRVWKRLTNLSTAPKPYYGPLADTGDGGGEFIFTRRQAARAPVASDPPDEETAPRPKPGPFSRVVEVAGRGITPVSLPVEKGDKITIRASGTVTAGASVGDVPPEGKNNMVVLGFTVPIAEGYDLIPKLPHGALLYQLSTDGNKAWRLCGDGCELVAPATGKLEITFQLNDSQQHDNTGKFKVFVTVYR